MVVTRYAGSLVLVPVSGGREAVPFEWFELSVNPDRSRTLCTLSRFPGNAIVRQVSHSVDAGFGPLEGYARLFVDGVYAGSVLRQVTGDVVRSTLLHPDGTDDRADIEIGLGTVLGFHPVVGEGWKFVGSPRGVGEQLLRVLTTSPTWNGGRMAHGRVVETSFEWLADEEVPTRAGCFSCEHVMWHTGAIDQDIEMWLLPPDGLCVRVLQHSRGMVFELDSFGEQVLGDRPELEYA